MAIVKTSDLIGPALDWAVAKCDGKMLTPYAYGFLTSNGYPFRPSSNWGQGGLVIEREDLHWGFGGLKDGVRPVVASKRGHMQKPMLGPTPLIAAMRCYCCAKLGDEIDIPEELCQSQNS